MSEPQQYTLNQSVTIEPGPSEDSVNVWLGNVCLNFPSHLASSVFVPLDIPAIEKQLDSLIDDFRWSQNLTQVEDIISINVDNGAREKFVAEIKAVFGLDNKETVSE